MTASELLIQLPCICASMRRATRAVTRLYDQELREVALRSTQFTLLQVLHLAGSMTQGDLDSLLSLDSTTLSRSLQPLVAAGWVKSERGEDRRERHLRLTASGERKFQDALPAWRRAQKQLTKTIGRDWERLERDLRQIAGSVT
jgi:DNA-binding MarR family transcriptional regulator